MQYSSKLFFLYLVFGFARALATEKHGSLGYLSEPVSDDTSDVEGGDDSDVESGFDRKLYSKKCDALFLPKHGQILSSLPKEAGKSPGVIANIVLHSVTSYRKESEVWDQKTLQNLKIAYCESQSFSKSRWVPNTNPLAALNNSGSCIFSGDVQHPPPPDSCGIVPPNQTWTHSQNRTSSGFANQTLMHNATVTTPHLYCCEIVENCFWGPVILGQNRTAHYTSQQVEDASKLFRDYVNEMIYPALPASFFACAVFLGAPLYGVFHLCFRWCRLRLQGYTGLEKYIPFFFYNVFCFIAIAGMVWALFADFGLTRVVNRIFVLFPKVLQDSQKFALDLVTPLQKFQKGLQTKTPTVQTMLSKIPNPSNLTYELFFSIQLWQQRYSRFSHSKYSKFNMTSQASILAQTANTQFTPLLNVMTKTISTVQKSYVSQTDELMGSTIHGAILLTEFNASLGHLKDVAKGLEPTAMYYGNLRSYAVYGILISSAGLSFFTLLLMSVAAFQLYGHKCLLYTVDATWSLNWLVTTAGFVALAGATVGVLLMQDGCRFLDMISADFKPYFGSGSGTVFNTCINGNQTLISGLNLTAPLDLMANLSSALGAVIYLNPSSAAGVVLSKFHTTDSSLESLISFSPLFQNLSAYTNGSVVYGGQTDRSLGQACHFAEDYLTEAEILEPWVSNQYRNGTLAVRESYQRQRDETAAAYMARLYQNPGCPNLGRKIMTSFYNAYNNVLQKLQMERDLGYNPQVCAAYGCPSESWPLKRSVFEILEVSTTNITSLQTDLALIYGMIRTSLLDPTTTFECSMDCKFMKSYFGWLQSDLCLTLAGNISQLGLCLACLLLCNIPLMILSCMLSRRLREPRFVKAVVPTIEDDYRIFTKKINVKQFVRKRN